MRVHDEHVPAELYGLFIERMPQACVELVIERPEGILLAKRTKEPAAGEWFWPGSRLYKGERLADAAHRVASDELGIGITLAERLGVYAHF
jgi:colanic acid biosynthesis protein WcaH